MKKILKCAICLILVFSTFMLCGCDDSKSLVGEYEAQRDYAALFNYIMNESAEENTLKVMSLKAVEKISFNEDGTYKVAVEENEIENVKRNAREQLRTALVSYYVKLIADSGLNVTADQYLASVGTSFEDLLREMKIEETVEKMFSTSCFEGRYKANKGRLYRSNSLDTTYDKKVYETYTLIGGVLTLKESINEKEEKSEEEIKIEKMLYPIKYVKK